MKAGSIKLHDVLQVNYRADASYHLSEGRTVKRFIAHSPYPLTTIGEVSKRIFYGNRARRVYVSDKEHGIPFLSSSDILQADLEHVKLASKKYTPDVEGMALQKGWILISRSGTVGNCAFASRLHAQKLASEDVIRLVPDYILRAGVIYAYLASKYGHSLLTQGVFGAVIQHIEPAFIASLPIPMFPESFQAEVDDLIQESARLREEANDMLEEARIELKKNAHLRDLSEEDYDYYGPHSYKRNVSCFVINRKEINTTTINAFNLSERIRKTKAMMICPTKPLKDILLGGDTFSTGSFPRVEVKEGHGVMLINQRDIFDTIIKGKNISKYGVNMDNLVEYGEVIIAGVGTLGENETFCRALFANEDLVGQLVSGEFIRMKTNNEVPSGYLFAWLSTDYGFRFLRNIQAGTKLCRPIPRLVREIPVPILDKDIMSEIDSKVRDAYTKRHKANVYELKAISMVENEIEKWNKAN